MPEGFRPTEEGIEAVEGAKVGKGELYNLQHDLRERKDLHAEKPQLAAEPSQLMVHCGREGRSWP